MNTQAKLDAYSNAVLALEQHKRENINVFSAHETLLNKVIDAENELRDEIILTSETPKNKTHETKMTPQSQTFADIEVIDQLIKEGKIAPGLRDLIVKTNVRPPYIGIRPVQD